MISDYFDFGDNMKKYTLFLAIFVFCISLAPAYSAASVEVQAMSEFNSIAPVSTMKVMVMQPIEFENGIKFENGTIIEGNVVEVKQPKRAKRNASFKFHPTSYTFNGRTTTVTDEDFIAKYKEKKDLNKGEIALSTATTVGGFFLKIPGLSQGISLVKGMVKNKEDGRLKSGVVQVYKDSPLSYVEEGKDIFIKKDDIFYLKFKTHKSENLDEEENASIEQPVQPAKESVNSTQKDENIESQKVNNIKSSHPDEVLREVELNSK